MPATLLQKMNEFDELAHRASALGFTLDAKASGPLQSVYHNVSYLVTKDDILILHTKDEYLVRAYIQLMEFVSVTN